MTSSQVLWALLAILSVQAVTDLSVLVIGRRPTDLLRWLPFLVSGAAGVLLATACLDLLPEAVRRSGGDPSVWLIFLGSLLALFCLGTLTNSEDVHIPHDTGLEATTVQGLEAAFPAMGHHHHGSRSKGMAPLLLGSALHSAIDGLAIATAFAAGRGPGWTAAIAVGLHELPHRLGDFSLLVHKGLTRRLAAQLAIGAGAAAFAGGLAVLAFGHYAQAARWLLPVSAASFLYIALVDLVPEVQSQPRSGRMPWEIVCLLGGAALIAIVIHFSGE